jgi:hypothetical protein
MNKIYLLLLIVTSFWSALSRADLSCIEECTRMGGQCMELGTRARTAALHLNAIMNIANPVSALDWAPSRCDRELEVSGAKIFSAGVTCVEWMEPLLGGHGGQGESGSARTWMRGAFEGLMQIVDGRIEVVFPKPSVAPNFSFIWSGMVTGGGPIEYITHVPASAKRGQERLLIATSTMCFTVD